MALFSGSRRLIKLLPVFMALVIAAGCSSGEKNVSSRYEISDSKPDGAALSRNVVLVADNQLNYLFGGPVWMRSEFTHKVVSVAIRPVQQDLFGPELLRWAMDIYGSQYPVIHLGDGTNMACTGELESFMQIMSTAKKPWFMAPGNHDAYYMGNLHHVEGDWTTACQGADGPMTKDRFVERYLRHIQEQHEDFRTSFPAEVPKSGKWQANPASVNLLRSVAWTVDSDRPWRSFVVQELDLTAHGSTQPVVAILLDSSQYASAPSLVPTPICPNAGVNGDIQPDQIKIVEEWLKDDASAHRMIFLMLHHPFGTLLDEAGKAVESMRERYDIPMLVSAHTHLGEYIARGGTPEHEGWLELNVGSIVDSPIELRTFSIHADRDNPKKTIFRTKLFRIPDCWESGELVAPQAPTINPDWEAKPEDPDYYLSYYDSSSPDPEKTQDDLMKALLYSHLRMIENVPSAPDNAVWPADCSSDEAVKQKIELAASTFDLKGKIDFLVQLSAFDQARKCKDPLMHRDYKMAQAIWASKYNKLERRKFIPSDSYIIFNKEVDANAK